MKLLKQFYKIAFIIVVLILGFPSIDSLLISQDQDLDTIIDSLDLDDDNDGILDTEESLGFNPKQLGSCTFPQVVFHANAVTQVSGNVGAPFVGDQFRFSNVATINAIPLDAVITIVEADPNITTFTIDNDSTGNPDAWQAEYNVPAGESATMKYSIEFKVANTSAVVPLARFGGTFYDIDGVNANESITLSIPDFYAVEKTTELTVSSDTVGDVTFQGPLVTYPGVVLDTKVAMYFNYFNINSFSFSTTGNNVTSTDNTNFFSLFFNVCSLEDFTDFSYVILNGIDSDGDNIPDHLDVDSDNDGCFDALEAAGNFTVVDVDMITGQLIGNVDTSGVPVVTNGGQDSKMDVIITGPDVDQDGISDACDEVDNRVDSDNDGIFDIADLDDDNDGILDKEEGGPFCDNSVLTSINTKMTNGVLDYMIGEDLSGQLPIELNNGLYTFNATLYDGTNDAGTPVWGNGIQIRNDQGAEIGDYLYLQALNVGQEVSGDYVEYEFNFPIALDLFRFSIAGLNKTDYVEITAYNGNSQIPVLASSDFSDFTPSLASGTWDVGANRVIGKSTTGGTDVDINYFIANIKGPVTKILISSGHGNNTDGTSTIAFHTLVGCSPGLGLDTDNDGIKNYLDTDSDGDGCSDADEAYGVSGTDTNGDGTWGGLITTDDVNAVGLVNDAGINGNLVSYLVSPLLNSTGNIAYKEATRVVSIDSNPTDKFVVDSSATSFSVQASASTATGYIDGIPSYESVGNANAGLQYQWQRNGEIIDASLDGGVYTNFNSAILSISNVAGLNGNVYTVLITHPDNVCASISKSATLFIVPLDTDGDGDPDTSDPAPNDPCTWSASQTLANATTTWKNSDCDGDGVINIDEVMPPDGEFATDPNNPCDFNGAQQTSPHVGWDNADCDGDGIVNKDELNPPDGEPATNPYDPCDFVYTDVTVTAVSTGDCDGDGVSNADEINSTGPGDPRTNPNNPCDFNIAEQGASHPGWDAKDCDGDGVINADEVNPPDGESVTNPYDPCDFIFTDITVMATDMGDCDGDGVTNADEVNSTGPNDPRTDPSNPCDFNSAEQGTPDTAWNDADCDLDGNPNGDDPNPRTPTANDDNDTAPYGSTKTIDILSNDDFLANDGNTIVEILGGTASGTSTFNPVSGTMDYTPTDTEPGTTVTVIYEVCHGTVCDQATVTIIVPPAGDDDGDGDPNNTDPEPNNPCVWGAWQVLADATPAWNNADCDGDGVTNLKEVDPNETGSIDLVNGTNPLEPCDFDLDDVTLVVTYSGDCDGDGVSNADEMSFSPGDPQTDPKNPCDFNKSEQATPNDAWNMADCDSDGNPNVTDPNPTTPTANDDAKTAPYGQITTIDVLGNDDFLPNDGNTIEEIPGGSAGGTITFDPVTGTMNYTPLESEQGTVVTVNYEVCQLSVCAQAIVTITVPDALDDDGDGDPNNTDPEPNDPCVWGAGQVLADATMTWNNADCDGDGVTNLKEVDPNETGFVDPNGTNPNDPCDFVVADITLPITSGADCDGDGVLNVDEINSGTGDPQTDPFDPCDFNTSEQGTPDTAWNNADCDGDGNPNGDDPNPRTPTAVDDAFVAPYGTTTSFDILENDDFLENDGNTIVEIPGGTAGGTIVFDPVTGDIDYTPLASEQGTVVTVNYKVCHGAVCDEAVITITIGSKLTVVDDNDMTYEEVPVEINIYDNDSFIPNDGTITVTNPSNGTVTITDPNNTPDDPSDDVVTYTPDLDFNGTDTFDYTVCDADNNCVTATVTVIVLPVMDLVDDEYVTDENVAIVTDIYVNDDDIPTNGTITTTEPQHGTVTITDPNNTPNDPSDNVVTYTPDMGYTGTDTFVYTVCDNTFPSGMTNCFNANVLITINPMNHPPVAVDDHDIPLSGNVLLDNDSDPDGDDLTVTLVDGPKNGTVTVSADGSYIYTPNPGFFGMDSFVYMICDTGMPPLCDEATAFLTIEKTEFDVPNVMTPDGDGVNDEFIIAGISQYPDNELKIYNRWGDVVYEKKNYDNSWKATYKDLDVPAGTYFYFLKLDPNSDAVLKGFITIVR